jgi:hypothetical protein
MSIAFHHSVGEKEVLGDEAGRLYNIHQMFLIV